MKDSDSQRSAGVKMDSGIRCDVCGRFISYADLESGAASHTMITPSSDWSYETWETFCPKCNKSVNPPPAGEKEK